LDADGRSAHLIRLAKAQAALDAHALEVTARWDANVDWSTEARSAGAWLAPRCGQTKATAGHRVKVARVLRRAPLAHKSLAAGRLTFPKVSLLEKHLKTERHWDAYEDAEADIVAVLETLTVEQCAVYLNQWARAADPDWAQRETEDRHKNRNAKLSTTLGGSATSPPISPPRPPSSSSPCCRTSPTRCAEQTATTSQPNNAAPKAS